MPTKLPDLSLPDQGGAPRSLSELAGGDPLILHTFRGHWCPKEQRFFRRLVALQDELEVGYARLASLSVDPPEVNAAFRSGLGARWTFLSDADRSAQSRLRLRETTDTVHAPYVPRVFVLLPDLTVAAEYDGYWYWGGRRPASWCASCARPRGGSGPTTTRPRRERAARLARARPRPAGGRDGRGPCRGGGRRPARLARRLAAGGQARPSRPARRPGRVLAGRPGRLGVLPPPRGARRDLRRPGGPARPPARARRGGTVDGGHHARVRRSATSAARWSRRRRSGGSPTPSRSSGAGAGCRSRRACSPAARSACPRR